MGPSNYMTGDAVPNGGSANHFIDGLTVPLLDLEVGGNHACVLGSDAKVKCWGSNFSELLGSVGPDSSVPRDVALPVGFSATQVSLGYNHGAAISSVGELLTWGYNPWLDLGHSGTLPAPVDGLPGKIVDVAGGQYHMCARSSRDDGAKVFCWGLEDAALGMGSMFGSISATEIAGLSTPDLGVDLARSVAVGDRVTCVLAGAGEVACWGSNSALLLGVPQAELASSSVPLVIFGLPARAKEVQVSQQRACAWLATNDVYCWGVGAAGSSNPPTHIPQLAAINALAFANTMGTRAFSLTADGVWLSWGDSGVAAGRFYGDPQQPLPCCDFF
jgi:alpha-tubulin suppressor-like RCC1 family protein